MHYRVRGDVAMAGNSNLHMSRSGKTDEFYTQLSTIEDELRHYRSYFKGKVIFCNADDPAIGEDGQDHYGDGLGGYTSNFFRYFQLNFQQLGIKKLITTHYVAGKPSYKFEIVSNDSGEQIGLPDYIKTPLTGDGDFRSPECLELLKECDIVVTNPPFSLMKEFIPLVMESGKQFLVLGNVNHVTFKEIFHRFKSNEMWLGYHSGHFWFRVPDYYEEKNTDFKIDEHGQKWRRMGNICWFTNMDIQKRHEPLELFKTFNEADYPEYDFYHAYFVPSVAEIPCDTDKPLAVPIQFLSSYSPEQFEILDANEYRKYDTVPIKSHGLIKDKDGAIQGKAKYARLLIRNKHPQKEGEQ